MIRPCLPTVLDVVVDDEIDMASSPEPVQVLDEIVADSADSSDSNNQGSSSRRPSVVKQRHHDSQQQHMKLDNTYAADILDSQLRSQNSGNHAYATIESDRVPSTPEEDVQCTKWLRMASVDVVQERA
ncbi:hypothetical protein BGZ99_005247 [Dissophora globulifera]|uniref:Uncharacterized protein n=1 Tax=Dissophora globulifera TaxID=979702 RepID=A0A9P6RHP4_9FUNG|nr:hypothetical protein BGZ99_005247 [Dissophora globulifera]